MFWVTRGKYVAHIKIAANSLIIELINETGQLHGAKQKLVPDVLDTNAHSQFLG